MSKVMHGVVHGKTIEVSEDLGLSDGQAVDVIVMPADLSDKATGTRQTEGLPKKLPGPPSGWKPGNSSATAGLLADEWNEEDDKILGEIHAERKAAKWREQPE